MGRRAKSFTSAERSIHNKEKQKERRTTQQYVYNSSSLHISLDFTVANLYLLLNAIHHTGSGMAAKAHMLSASLPV